MRVVDCPGARLAQWGIVHDLRAVDGPWSGRYVPRSMLRIVINGESREVREGTTVADLVAQLGLRREHVAVELDREIVPRAEHEARVLQDGSTLEIVTFVGGG